MERFCRQINAQEKVPYESQIALWGYLSAIGQGQGFEDFIMSERLINQFNAHIRDSQIQVRLEQVLRREADTVRGLLNTFRTKPWTVVKPVVWNSNLGNGYFIKNLTLSHRFEIYIDCMFRQQGLDIGLYYGRDQQYSGENAAGIEIKRDMMAASTGNLYIEYAERHHADGGRWVDSGILKTDNSQFFLMGDIGRYYVLRKADLLALYRALTDTPPRPVPQGVRRTKARRDTSLGFLIPAQTAKTMEPSWAELARCCKRVEA